MPELPEVETVRRGLESLEGATLEAIAVRDVRLRRRVDVGALRRLRGRVLDPLERRAKYLLMPTSGGGGMIVHLGMSGRLFMADPADELGVHDHVSWWFSKGRVTTELRFRDPRRFGLVVARNRGALADHELFGHLGPEPLGDGFQGAYAHARTRGSRRPVKNALMDARFVVGVGNIYASEALWRAGINPKVAAGRISRRRWEVLVDAVRDVLAQAIEDGGTTLNDFFGASGNPGYFQTRLNTYDRAGQPCPRCAAPIRRIVQSNRATYYCSRCQH